jgi:hypothetical protein
MGKHRGNLGITAGFLVVALLMGNSSWAQTASDEFGITPGSTSVTFFAGVSNSSSSENKKFNLEANTGTPVGGRVAYNFSSHHAVEFSIANPFSVSVNYVYHFSPVFRHWVSYMTAAVGGARRELSLGDQTQSVNSSLNDSGNDRNQTACTGNFGGGVLYLIGHRLATRFDVRDQVGHYKATFAGVPGVPTGVVKADQTIHDAQTTGGLVLRFAGR